MTPHILIPGLWCKIEGDETPWYIGNVYSNTAHLLRPVIKDGKQMTDSHQTTFNNLLGVALTRDILMDCFGFKQSAIPGREECACFELYPAVNITRGDTTEELKPPTYLYIIIDESGKRFTTFMEYGENKIYLSELSYVHELQILIFAHKYSFPIIKLI